MVIIAPVNISFSPFPVVVSPPQIEAHPRDVVDVVTGTSALFSVSVVSAAGEEVRRGGEGGEGGGGRERVGSGTWEDLQIMWEVLKTNSQSPAAMNEDIGEPLSLPSLVPPGDHL